jgi:capsule polysaccharide export protein KpsE/RkpR
MVSTEIDERIAAAHSRDNFSEMVPDNRLLFLAKLFWGRRRFLFRVSAIVASFTLLIGLFTPNSYRSTTKLMPPNSQTGSGLAALAGLTSQLQGAGGGGLGMLAGNFLGLQSTGALFVSVLQSRTAEEDLVRKFDLTSTYGYPLLHWRMSAEKTRKQLEDNTEISEDRKSGTISISVTDNDKQRATALANAYVDELNQLIASLSTSSARREREFLEQRLVQVKKDLDEDSRRLSEFSSKNATFDPKDQGRAMVEATATLQGELMAAQSALQGLEAIYAENNVRIRSLRARILELKRQLGSISGTDESALSPSASTADRPLPSMRDLPLLGATYSDLFRQAKIQETVYEILTQQYEIAKVEEAKEIPTVRVLDKANFPDKKWGPHRLINAVLGGIAGFLLACVFVIVEDEWNKRDIQDPFKVFILEVFNTIYNLRFVRWAGRLISRRSRRLLHPES